MLEKINDKNNWDLDDCKHLEHNPPMHMVLEDGTYKNTCPSCGKVTIFTVKGPVLCFS